MNASDFDQYFLEMATAMTGSDYDDEDEATDEVDVPVMPMSPVTAPVVQNNAPITLASNATPYNPQVVHMLFAMVASSNPPLSTTEITWANAVKASIEYFTYYWAKSFSPPTAWFYNVRKNQFDQIPYASLLDATMLNCSFICPTNDKIKFNMAAYFKNKHVTSIVTPIVAPTHPERVFWRGNELCINLFKGFMHPPTPIEPVTPSADLMIMLKHIFEVWCDSKQSSYQYVIKWLAQIAQVKKCNTILYLQSGQGTGKSCITEWLTKKVFGASCCLITDDVNDILGDFATASLTGKVMIVLEEMPSVSKTQWHSLGSRLKNLATGSTLRVNEKFKTSYDADNWLSLIIFSNNTAVKLESGDRRYAALDVSSKYVDNKAYFDRLHRISARDDIGKEMYDYLRTIDLIRFSDLGELKQIGTDARTEHIAASLSPFYQFLKYQYICAANPQPYDGSFTSLYELYEHWITSTKYTADSKIKVSKQMSQLGFTFPKRKVGGKTTAWGSFTPTELYAIYKRNNWIHSTDDINSTLEG